MVVPETPRALSVNFSDDKMTVALEDGREVSVPLAWFPLLLGATKEQRANYRTIGGGIGLHWPELDEDISVAALLARPLAPRPAVNREVSPEKSSRVPHEQLGDNQNVMNGGDGESWHA